MIIIFFIEIAFLYRRFKGEVQIVKDSLSLI